MSAVPVITVDGPAASGKGTIAAAVAARLGFHYLDSGALYRLVALKALRTGTAFDASAALTALAAALDIRFTEATVLLDGGDVTAAIREQRGRGVAPPVADLEPTRPHSF